MKYMLDTNICIYAIKNKPPEVIRNFLQHDPDDMCISSITYGELMHGVEKSQAVEKNRIAMSLFLSPITILDLEKSGQIWKEKELRLDHWICSLQVMQNQKGLRW